MRRMDAVEAATRIVEDRFPHCLAAILAGSVVRGEATVGSDLDLVVVNHAGSAHRESFYMKGWPVELFVHNETSYLDFFRLDCDRGIPSLPNMFAEGILLKDNGIAAQIKEEAEKILAQGPKPWSTEEVKYKRYEITDLVIDFESSTDRGEDLCIAQSLSFVLHEFVLRTNGYWIGKGKWMMRALKRYDPALADRFISVFDQFYQTGNKKDLTAFANHLLQAEGGRLFDGFSAGNKEEFDAENGHI